MDDDPIDAWKPLALSVSTTRRCLTATCAGVGSEGDDNAAEQIPDVEVMQPAGFMANPALTATSEAIAVRRGDELIALFLVDKGAAAQAVESGETRLYGVGASNATAVRSPLPMRRERRNCDGREVMVISLRSRCDAW